MLEGLLLTSWTASKSSRNCFGYEIREHLSYHGICDMWKWIWGSWWFGIYSYIGGFRPKRGWDFGNFILRLVFSRLADFSKNNSSPKPSHLSTWLSQCLGDFWCSFEGNRGLNAYINKRISVQWWLGIADWGIGFWGSSIRWFCWAHGTDRCW